MNIRSTDTVKSRRPLLTFSCVRLAQSIVLGWLVAAGACVARAQSFTNTTSILIPLAGGPVSPYPSSITVGSLTGNVLRVTVTLNDVVHTFPDDLDVLLVGPGGQTVMLMSDAGGGNPVGGVNLTFSKDSGAVLPDAGQITSGTYRPTDYEPGDVLPGAVPPGPYGSDLGIFAGTDPNGTWELYVSDDTAATGDGSIGGGWVLILDLALPASIATHPQDQLVAPGGTATFEVVPDGTSPFGYEWRRNGQVVVPFGLGSATLSITNVQVADAGYYSVVVTNSANPTGAVSSNAFLNVLGPLTLVEPLQDQIVAPGDSVVFQVTAAGMPPLRYQWRLNGALLADDTNATLVLSDVQATNGGSFSVTVWNDSDALTTGQAQLLVPDSTGPEAADSFDDRPTIESAAVLQGVLQGNSAAATNEPGEPVFPGGGKSVWYEWVAPSNGIVTLSLRGSAFDTLLGVFTGTVVSDLTLVTLDDDQGGFYTSTLQFNARAGLAYEWLVDGFDFAGIGGDYTLSWKLEPTLDRIPVIVSYPQPQGVLVGSNATFSVVTEAPDLDTYQWLFNDVPVPGATNPVFVVTNVQSWNVGFYTVQVQNQSGSSKKSPPAALQSGSHSGSMPNFPSQAFDKFQNVDLPLAISVGLGDTGWNEFPSEANGSPGDPNPCDYPFFNTLFQGVTALDDGVIRVDTEGSEVFMLLAVYRSIPGLPDATLLKCDVVSGPFSQPCVVQYDASKDTNYTVVVSTLQSASTNIVKVTATMGAAPPIPDAPQCIAVESGGSHQLQAPTNGWIPPPSLQWRFNGQDIPDATNATWLLSNFNVTLAGTYSVVLSNFVGVITNTVAYVSQSGPPVLHAQLIPSDSGHLDALIMGSGGQPFALQSAAALSGPWTDVATNPNPCYPLRYSNLDVLLESQEFYRAILWTPPPEP